MELFIQYGPFLVAALLLMIAPGPDLVYVSTQTMVHGRRVGVFSTMGVCSGALVHVLAAALGLSAILAASAIAFGIVKWVGVIYLIWLGITAIRQTLNPAKETVSQQQIPAAIGTSGADGVLKNDDRITMIQKPKISAFGAWRQGAMIDVLNPKVALFFMAFLPQFVHPEFGHQSLQLLILGLSVIVIGFVVECGVVFLIASASGRFRVNRRFGIWMERALGAVFIGLGVRLALISQRH